MNVQRPGKTGSYLALSLLFCCLTAEWSIECTLLSQFIDVLESTSRPETTVETLTKVTHPFPSGSFWSHEPSLCRGCLWETFIFILQSFQDQATSDYVVCYLRILTSGYLQSNADFFQAFIEGGRTVKEYCSQVNVFPGGSSTLDSFPGPRVQLVP